MDRSKYFKSIESWTYKAATERKAQPDDYIIHLIRLVQCMRCSRKPNSVVCAIKDGVESLKESHSVDEVQSRSTVRADLSINLSVVSITLLLEIESKNVHPQQSKKCRRKNLQWQRWEREARSIAMVYF